MYIIINAFQSLMLPRAARAYAEGGRHAMFRLLAPATVVVFAMLFTYAALVGIIGKQLLGVLYGHAYDDYAGLIWYVRARLPVRAPDAGCRTGADGRRAAHVRYFISRMVVVPFTLTAGMWITWQFGLYGAAFASCVLASGAILGMQYAFLLHGERRGRGTSESDTSLAATGGNSR